MTEGNISNSVLIFVIIHRFQIFCLNVAFFDLDRFGKSSLINRFVNRELTAKIDGALVRRMNIDDQISKLKVRK